MSTNFIENSKFLKIFSFLFVFFAVWGIITFNKIETNWTKSHTQIERRIYWKENRTKNLQEHVNELEQNSVI